MRTHAAAAGLACIALALSSLAAFAAPEELVQFAQGLATPESSAPRTTRSGLPELFTSGAHQLEMRAKSDASAQEKCQRLFEAYLQDAKAGDPVAQASLSRMYLLGIGVAEDPREVLSWARKAADQGDPIGMLYTGDAYEYGRGTQENLQQAVQWYLKAAPLLQQRIGEASRKDLVQGQAIIEKKQFYFAWLHLNQAVELAPWSPVARYNKALVEAEVGGPKNDPAWFAKAIHDMKVFLALAPDSPQARGGQDLIYRWELTAPQSTPAGVAPGPDASPATPNALDLVGRWLSHSEANGLVYDELLIARPNGTATRKIKITYPNGELVARMVRENQWRLSGRTLFRSCVSVTIDGRPNSCSASPEHGKITSWTPSDWEVDFGSARNPPTQHYKKVAEGVDLD